MSIKIVGGIVSLTTNPKVKAIVNTIDFPNVNRVHGQVPIGAQGVMVIKNVPDHQNFVPGNILNYRDSNNNNNAQLTVNSVVGPTKYNVTRTA
ncbi:hypothetical protein [Aquimarina aggregata]|uniref:hypothetical protein n=1 Tax=Aquimarina aggregata TaxID=1642818 RepID=UPI002490C2B0|nr:hypothetical protein [Aquimarina aggregata]